MPGVELVQQLVEDPHLPADRHDFLLPVGIVLGLDAHEQPGVVAHFPQLYQRVLVIFVESPDGLLLQQSDVDVGLYFGEPDVHVNFRFGRELVLEIVFGSLQNKRLENLVQSGDVLDVSLVLLIVFDLLYLGHVEQFLVAEHFRHDEIQKASELEEVVLEGGSGHQQLAMGFELP